MHPLLLLLALLLPVGAETEKIIGGHEAKPHSRPYMAFVQFLDKDNKKDSKKRCGGVLVHKDFVLTAGDSGGPLVCNNMVQGIFSYGKNDGTPPGVFMKVSHFLPWIKRTIKHL
uniref:Granzyme H n=1 Tax=Canis lupus dingo TaxID=286419 RepID=A0A8C0LJE9_CANLU